MTQWTELVMTHMFPWPIGVLVVASGLSLLFGVIGVVALSRVRRLLGVVPEMQERLETLSHSTSLLTDTTESCFKALSMQLQFMQSQHLRPATAETRTRAASVNDQEDVSARKAKQRRVVGAARRGETFSSIAAREDVSESEIALRLHVNREAPSAADARRHGTL
jgi:hypothetical protein